MFLQKVAKSVAERIPEFNVYTEYSNLLNIDLPNNKLVSFGDVNPTWNGDIMSLDNQEYDYDVEANQKFDFQTHISINEQNPEILAGAIVCLIRQYFKTL